MKKERREHSKRVKTYEEQHNAAFSRFQKFSGSLIWAGILNVVSLIIIIVQGATGAIENNAVTFNFCFGISDLTFRLLALIPFFTSGGEWLYYLTIVIIAMIYSTGAIFLGVMCRKGKIKALWAGAIIYLLDAFLVIPSSLWLSQSVLGMWIMVGLHVVILALQAYAIVIYYQIVDLAIHYQIINPQVEEKEGVEQ